MSEADAHPLDAALEPSPVPLVSPPVGLGAAPGRTETVLAFGKFRLFLKQRRLFSGKSALALGSTGLEILITLIEAEGKLVTKDDLLKRVWPRTKVEEHNVDVQISSLRKVLRTGRHFVRTEKGRGYRFTGSVQKIVVRSDAPSLDPACSGDLLPLPERSTNLPAPISSLVGRARELSDLQGLLGTYRHVTLIGGSGIGKTQLGLAAAREAAPRFPDGAWLVELAPLSDPQLVPAAIARVLAVELDSEARLIDQLVAFLSDKTLLLVLDNCEHVVQAAAPTVEMLLRSAPRMHVLATSQEPLSTEGEQTFHVGPLEFPRGAPCDRAEAMKHSAVQLFVQRAQAAQSSFALDERNVGMVAMICRQLDGVPLAIELAATRVTTIGLREVATRLTDRFRLLTGGRRTALQRHQTLRTALDWSYDLLTAADQTVLRRLAIFAGSFTLSGAAAVATDQITDEWLLGERLAGLVSKSFVMVDAYEPVHRYRLLETMRAYASEKLAETSERPLLSRRHATYCLKLLESADLRSRTMSVVEAAATFGPEIDNLRVALSWAISPEGDAELGVAILTAVISISMLLPVLHEYRPFVHAALSHLSANNPSHARQEMQLHLALGISSLWTNRADADTYCSAMRALCLAEQLENVGCELTALYLLWVHLSSIGEYRKSLAMVDRFRRTAARANDMCAGVVADRMQATSLVFMAKYQEAVTICRGPWDGYVGGRHENAIRFGLDQRVGLLICMALARWFQGFKDQAWQLAKESVEAARASNHVNTLCLALSFGTCYLAVLSENLAALEEHVPLLTSLADQHALGIWQSDCLIFRGWIAIQRGDVATGLGLLTRRARDRQKAAAELQQTIIAGALSQALASIGKVKEGLVVINEAIGASTRCEGYWCLPELLRLRAALRLQQGAPEGARAAERDLIEALQSAETQEAKSWQLRIATDLSRLWYRDSRIVEARDILARVYDWFTEGFDSADFVAATALREMLQ